MAAMTGLDGKIREMAGRIRELREIQGFTQEEMAHRTGVSLEEYILNESGHGDLHFAFLYRCAAELNVNVTDIIEGYSPKLKSYALTRRGAAQEVNTAHGMTYYNMAYSFQNRIAEPLYVKVLFDEKAAASDIELTTHSGQECDIVISGNLMVQVGEHKEILGPGDSMYYDSGTPHGMVAVNGRDCEFYAIVLNPEGEPIPELQPVRAEEDRSAVIKRDDSDRIYRKYIEVTENGNGTPVSIRFRNTEGFNFAFDLVDALAQKDPDKLAMLHVSKDMTERRFTFKDMSAWSSRAANYFKAIGIRKGDRVMLMLKRHYQFWFAMLGLNKLGAIAIPAVSQLQVHDLEYRFNAAGISAVIATADDGVPERIDEAADQCSGLKYKILVNGKRDGWRSFDEEIEMYRSHFERGADAPGGDDLMLMFFTSGTSGYPKIAAHDYKYALGHFHTARYWHNVDPDGLHFTISDTGWAKAMWGKLYGQWFCEAATFVYDFDRFDASVILPMFKKYGITSFCAPPTMLRMMIKQDLSRYDFSTVKHMSTAGEALNAEVYRQFERLTGLQIKEGFGQSESTMIIGNLVGSPHKVGSMGKPAPIYDVKLMDRNGDIIGDGETGEIVIDLRNGRPCGLLREYYNDPEKTAEAFRDGFYHTGDTAWRDEDEGSIGTLAGDDIIKSSGYRIGPFEIESVIMELPYVLECGVSAAPDEVRGQIVKASIVLTKGVEGTEELKKEIQDYVKAHTAPYKYPRLVVFRDELPKTVSGKIQRSRL